MREPRFRRAQESEWRAIRTLLATSRLPIEGARDHLGSFLVAHDESGLLACGGLELYGSAALLRSVAVDARHRSAGLGTELVTRLRLLALEREVDTLALLTESAESWFQRLGFRTVPRERLPAALKASAEFRGACPASATAMWLDLRPN
jgi:amino-acid N-acetyltransferase